MKGSEEVTVHLIRAETFPRSSFLYPDKPLIPSRLLFVRCTGTKRICGGRRRVVFCLNPFLI